MSERPTTALWLPVGFLAAFVAVGIPYWLIPYGQLGLPSALLRPGLLVVALVAGVARACRVGSAWRVAAIIGGSVPAAVVARVVVEGFRDPTSHNLWPFEVAIASAIGLPCALAGAIIGGALGALTARGAGGGRT